MANQTSRAIARNTTPFTSQEIELMRRTVARGASADQFMLFLEMCKHYRLNPLMRQIYCIVDKSGRMIIQTSIDGFRLMAERTGRYAGQLGPFWCGSNGEWSDVWLSPQPPAAAKVGVLRRDFAEPIWGVARYSSYARNTETWNKMGDLMLAKCSESLAFRRAFPAQMADIYSFEEMEQAGNAQAPQVTVEVVEEEQQTSGQTLAIAQTAAPDQVIDVDGQVKKLKHRALALDLAHDKEEWESLLQAAGVERIETPVDIATVSTFIAQYEEQVSE